MMKTTFAILLFLFFFCKNAVAQDYRFHLGLNANPFSLIAGNLEFVSFLETPKRFSVKPAVGISYNVDNSFRGFCKIDDEIANRITEGSYAKLSVDYSIIDAGSIKLYAGGNLFYSSFKKSGFNGLTGRQEKLEGQIFTGGINLGVRKKYFDFVYLDIGTQTLFHRGNRFNIGGACLNFIPGAGASGKENVFVILYFQVLFELKNVKE
jgi:hypothetical protein